MKFRPIFASFISFLIFPGGPGFAQTMTYAMGDDGPRGVSTPEPEIVHLASEEAPPMWAFDPEKTKIILLPVDDPLTVPAAGEAVPLDQLVTADALRGVDNWEDYQYESDNGLRVTDRNSAVLSRPSSRLNLKPVQTFSTGTRTWSLTTENNSRISLGSNQVINPIGQNTFRIGGLQLSRQSEGVQDNWFVDSNQLAYATAAGAMDYSAAAADAASFNFGSGAANTAVRYGLSDSTSVDTQLQIARSLKNLGLGASYALDDMGDVRWTVNAGRYDNESNWRSMFAYRAKVFDLATLQFSNELTSAGYMDLSRLSQAPLSDRAISNQLKLTYPLDTQSQLSGLLENSRVFNGVSEQRVGVEHSYKIDSLLLKLKAQRAVRSDNGSVQFDVGIPIGGR